MEKFHYFMPTNCYFGRGCVAERKAAMAGLGKKAMLVTGKTSAKKNGAQKDITDALDSLGIAWILFDEIEENPSVETIEKAAKLAIAEGVEFFIGIGGGSPMDSSKAIATMAANPEQGTDALWRRENRALPVVAVPTTAGTGSEVTQYAIVTLHAQRTKSSIAAYVFATVAFLDPKYMDTLPAGTTNNTAVDALTHLVESYLSAKATAISREIAKQGLLLFKECMPALRERAYTPETRDKLLLMSALGGVAIAQTMTSLPHGMGYFLTYEKGLPHGMANGVLTQAYLELFPVGDKNVAKVLEYLGLASTAELGTFLDAVLQHQTSYTEADIQGYTDRFLEQPAKLATFPYPLQREDIYRMYQKSLLK